VLSVSAAQAAVDQPLTAQQAALIDVVNSGQHVFITGKAGCGKTQAVAALIASMRAAGVPHAVTASTGFAAEPLGGVTLHSLLCLRDGQPAKTCAQQLRKYMHKFKLATSIQVSKHTYVHRYIGLCPLNQPSPHRAHPFSAPPPILQVLVIDEVSMLSAETFALGMEVLKTVRRSFGGMPVIVLSGDFLQLPAVRATTLLGSDVWTALAPTVLCLSKNFRQSQDRVFADVLDECRYGCLSAKSAAVLEGRVGVEFPLAPSVVTEIHPHKSAAARVNAVHLQALPAPKCRYLAHLFVGTDSRCGEAAAGAAAAGDADPPCEDAWDEDELFADLGGESAPRSYAVPWPAGQQATWQVAVGDLPRTEPLAYWKSKPFASEVAPSDVPPEWGAARVDLPPNEGVWMAAEQLVRDTLAPPVLELAVGAVVMFTANVDAPHIVNGSQGVVVEFHATGKPIVQLVRSGERVIVNPWPFTRRVHPDTDVPTVVMAQLPLQLAWAVTIHKSQGQTLDRARINLGSAVFERAQAYVALSRVRTLQGVALTDFRASSVFADEGIVEQYRVWETEAGCVAGVGDGGDHGDHGDHGGGGCTTPAGPDPAAPPSITRPMSRRKPSMRH
jgi:hypothetical protein